MTALHWTRSWTRTALLDGLRVFYLDVARGAMALLRHGLAMLGLLVAGLVALALLQPAWRENLRSGLEEHFPAWRSQDAAQAELRAWTGIVPLDAEDGGRSQAAEPSDRAGMGRLPASAETAALADVRPLDRATAADPSRLSKPQAAIATWLSRRYRVAPEPVSRIVEEAWQIGRRANLDPTLILAIMAVESSFNPFAQSKVGAQGLMQVMTQLHDKKYQPFGGAHAAFDPVTNMRVGVQVLKDFVQLTGDIPTALQYYSGAARLPNDQGYASKVLSEQDHLKNVAAGRNVAVMAPVNSTPRAVRPPGGMEPVKAVLPPASPAPAQTDAQLAAPEVEPTAAGHAPEAAVSSLGSVESSAAPMERSEASPTHPVATTTEETRTATAPLPAPNASAPSPEPSIERHPQI